MAVTREFLTIVTLLSVAGLSGCMPVHSREKLVGEYQLRNGDRRAKLTLAPDGRFTETISANGVTREYGGTWKFDERDAYLNLDGLQSKPLGLALTWPSKAEGVQAGEPEHWTITPEYVWGTVEIGISSDEDVIFRRDKPTIWKYILLLVSLWIAGFGLLQLFSPKTLKRVGDKLPWHRKREAPLAASFFDRFAGLVFAVVGLVMLLFTVMG